jgi:hypothetical protein
MWEPLWEPLPWPVGAAAVGAAAAGDTAVGAAGRRQGAAAMGAAVAVARGGRDRSRDVRTFQHRFSGLHISLRNRSAV